MILWGRLNRPRTRDVGVSRILEDDITRAFVRLHPVVPTKVKRKILRWKKTVKKSYYVEGVIVRQAKGEGPKSEVVYPAQTVLDGYTANPEEVFIIKEGKRLTWRPRRKVKKAMETAMLAVATHLQELGEAKKAKVQAEAELAVQGGRSGERRR